MNTRRAEIGSPLNQEKYCSSPEFERGLNANLVAKRVELLDEPADRALVWWIQKLSHAIGLEKLAADLVAQHRIIADWKASKHPELFCAKPGCKRSFLKKEEDAAVFPTREPAAGLLVEWLTVLCLDPSVALADCEPWFFPGLVSALRARMAASIEDRRAGMVLTEIGAGVHETLEYALHCGCLVIIEGAARTGKSHSAKDFCEIHPGEVRYVQVPCGSTDVEFQREIARAIGVSSALSRKGVELRERNKDALQAGRLMLVLDEGHFLWPCSNRREALPARINWILTVLVNAGVPVAIVSTPQFTDAQKFVEKHTGWHSEQFEGRVARHVRLPDRLEDKDLAAVARRHLPEGEKESIRLLVLYAKSSRKYLAAIEFAVKHARYLAGHAGRKECTLKDIAAAIKPDTGAPAAAPAPDHRAAPAEEPSETPAPFTRSTCPAASPVTHHALVAPKHPSGGGSRITSLLPD